MEKRHEYADGETITCPECGSDDIEPIDPSSITPNKGRCNACGLEFNIRQVAIYEVK